MNFKMELVKIVDENRMSPWGSWTRDTFDLGCQLGDFIRKIDSEGKGEGNCRQIYAMLDRVWVVALRPTRLVDGRTELEEKAFNKLTDKQKRMLTNTDILLGYMIAVRPDYKFSRSFQIPLTMCTLDGEIDKDITLWMLREFRRTVGATAMLPDEYTHRKTIDIWHEFLDLSDEDRCLVLDDEWLEYQAPWVRKCTSEFFSYFKPDEEDMDEIIRSRSIDTVADMFFPSTAPIMVRPLAEELHRHVCIDLSKGLSKEAVWELHKDKFYALTSVVESFMKEQYK